jgi:putative ABC transport system ATP-binding protein
VDSNYILETKDLVFQDMIFYQDIKIQNQKANFIIGKSGSGKSTLLRLFNGTLTPSGGIIFYQGVDITLIDTIELRQEILLISQSVYLFDMSIRDNFKQFYEYRNLPLISEKEMKDILNMCCIDFSLDKDCTTMSGGEKQRVYIAIYLSFLPKIVMLDEPTSALDKENSHRVIQNVINFCKEKGITMIVISHDPLLSENFSEQTIRIERRTE